MNDEPKRDEVAIDVVRGILEMHALPEEIAIDEAARLVRGAIDREVTAANAAPLDVATRALDTAAKLAIGEPAPESPNSPEEIRGRLLAWLRASGRRFSLEYVVTPSMWMARLSCQRSGSHVYRVKGSGDRLNHLDAIEDALDAVGFDAAGGGVTVTAGT